MPKSHAPHSPEFRQRIIELVGKGRTPEELARQFEPSAQATRNWVWQADRDAGHRHDGLPMPEQEELRRLRVAQAPRSARTRTDVRRSRRSIGSRVGPMARPAPTRIWAAQGIRVGRKRAARLMRVAHVYGVSRRKLFATMRRDPTASPAPDLVERQFQVTIGAECEPVAGVIRVIKD